MCVVFVHICSHQLIAQGHPEKVIAERAHSKTKGDAQYSCHARFHRVPRKARGGSARVPGS